MKLPLTKEQSGKLKAQMCIVAFTILLAAAVFYFGHIWGFVQKLFSISSPFILGFGLAFLLNPVMGRAEKLLNRYVFKRGNHPKLIRALSTLIAVLLFLTLLVLFFVVMVPQLVRSIGSIVNYISRFLKDHSSQINQILLKFDFLSFNGDELVVMWDNIVSSQINNITTLLDNLVLISSTIVNFLFDLLVSVITAFYILMDKDHLAALIKKIGFSLFPRERFDEIIFWTRRASRIFSGFITGKIVDSAIIGLICYFCMLIFKMEYAMLISIIVGVTNVIPFFGPFIGAVPGILILLLVNPMSALWFGIFILVLQQLDGNVIGPFILGDYVGVSALSIMIAIVIGSGLFGFAGMVLSVPVFALLYAIFRSTTIARLKKRGLPTQTADYVHAPENFSTEQTHEEN